MKKNLLCILVLFAITTTLCYAQNIMLWGTTGKGGVNNKGTIFSYNTSTKIETDVYDFVGGAIDGEQPMGSLFNADNGLLYGMTYEGGVNGLGTIFSYNPSTGKETPVYSFGNNSPDGEHPEFNSLIEVNGVLYGTTPVGGTYNVGTIFSYNISTGDEEDLYDFGTKGIADGGYPYCSLLNVNGVLYGTTSENNGGGGMDGTLFDYSISPSGEGSIWSFYSVFFTWGADPYGSLIQATNDSLYGMTAFGAGPGNDLGNGSIFSFSIAGNWAYTRYNFPTADGNLPFGSLMQDSQNDLLYGMTNQGGANSDGNIFSFAINSGAVQDLHDFTGSNGTQPDGALPYGSLVQASDNLLYGTTDKGGTNGEGTIFSYNISTVTETDLHNFGTGATDGQFLSGNLIEDDFPEPTITPQTPSICNGAKVTLTVNGGISPYTWSPSDGLSATTGTSVEANPTETTTYTVTSPSGISTVVVTVNELPDVKVNSPSVCSGSSVNLTASGASTYSWSPSTTLSSSTGSIVSANPTINTTYIVTGTSSAGCKGSATSVVTVNPLPVVLVNSPSVCSGSSVNLTASGASTYSWSPSATLNSSVGATVSASPILTTTYTVTGTDSSNCKANATSVVTVKPIPLAPTADCVPNPVCAGSTFDLTASTITGASYNWSGPNFTSTTQNPIINKALTGATGDYSVTAKVNGCTSPPGTIPVTVDSPVVTVTPPKDSMCIGALGVSLTASGASTYAWTPSAGLSCTGCFYTLVSATATTTYTVKGTDDNGCIGSATVVVKVNKLPSVTITATPTTAAMCAGGSIKLVAAGATTYSWAPSSSLSSSSAASVKATPKATTTYAVSGTNSSGCVKIIEKVVTVNPLPTVLVTANPTSVCTGKSSTLTAKGASTYTWSPSSSLNHSTGATVTTIPKANTNYIAKGTSTAGCTASSKSVTVTVKPCASGSPHDGENSDTDAITNQFAGNNALVNVYPNPNNGRVFVDVQLPKQGNVTIMVFDILGQLVYRQAGSKNVDRYQQWIDINNQPPGMYFIRVTAGDESINRKIVIVK